MVSVVGNLHLQDMGIDRTANHIDENAEQFIKDDYHALIITGARVLVRMGCGKFEYVAGYSSSTLWSDAPADNFITVRADGSIVGA
jgi:hypothetical protein